MAGSNTRDLVSGLFKPRRGKASSHKKTPAKKIIPVAGVGVGSSGLSSGGGGASSKYTEVPNSRLYYDDLKELKSTDGSLVMLYQNIYQMKFRDAGGSIVIYQFDNSTLP